MDKRWQRLFYITLLTVLAIKIVLTLRLPFSGDEAYFYLWGKYPALGFYDHPPMVGWVLSLMLLFGKSILSVRMPIIIFNSLIGIGLYEFLKRYDDQKAALAAILYLLSPLSLINVIITTDSPLIFFTFLSTITLYFAIRKENYGLYLLAGLFFGMAFLSKYFSAFLGLAYLAYFIFSAKTKKKALGFAIVFASLIPFIALNVYWNYNNDWANIMFNIFNRNQHAGFSIGTILMYLLYLVYLFSPFILLYLYKGHKEIKEIIREDRLNVIPYVFIIPFCLFGLLSTFKSIGAHWPLSFFAFAFVLAAFVFNEDQLRRCIKFMLVVSGLHLVLFALLLSFPSVLKHTKFYDSIVLGIEAQQIVDQIRPYETRYHLATPDYSDSAILSYHADRYFSVFGEGSYHARHDDIMTDFRKFKGQNILILAKRKTSLDDYRPYFAKVDLKQFRIKGVVFNMILGQGFNYERYRDVVLRRIKDQYYRIPTFLPRGKGYFNERYFK